MDAPMPFHIAGGLLVQGRMIPVPLAWFGVLASALLVVALPLQLAGVLGDPASQLIWIPLAAFEIPPAFHLNGAPCA
jgi:hypothetical protein